MRLAIEQETALRQMIDLGLALTFNREQAVLGACHRVLQWLGSGCQQLTK
jgi:hypothetical protein